MSTIVSLRVEEWGEKYIVVGEFRNHSVIDRRQFETYGEALKELAKIALREEVRYGSGFGRGSDR